ncbi:MAG: PAS domain S-box protein [Chloroflexota bacterium]|nr:PAS domain S-box protein [Chloroflexota bacterium]
MVNNTEEPSLPLFEELQTLRAKVEQLQLKQTQAEQTLKVQQTLLDNFYYTSPLMMGVVELVEDKDIRHLSANLATAHFFGHNPTEMQGQFANQRGVPSKQVQAWVTHCQESERQGRPIHFVYDHKTEEGVRWFSVTVAPIPAVFSAESREENQPQPFSYLVEDITQRKAIEEQLRASEEKYKVLFQIYPLGISITDEEGNLIETNPASEELLGISVEEQTQRSFDGPEWQIIRSDGSLMLPEEYASVRALREHQTVAEVEMGLVKGSGETTWLSVTATPIPLQGYGVAIAYVDITQRKQAEKIRLALAQEQVAREQVSHILESITDAFFALDYNWHFTYVNPQAEPLLKRRREELLGRNIWEEFPDALGSAFYQEYHKALSQKVTVAFEAFYSPFNVWFEVRAYPSQDGLSVYFQDISRRKKLEQELEIRRQTELRRQKALSAVAMAVNSQAGLDEVLEIAVVRLCEELAGSSASIFLLQPGGRYLEGRATIGFTAKANLKGELVDLQAMPSSALAVRTKQAGYFTIAEANNVEQAYFENLGFIETLVIPLLVEDEPIGIGYVNYAKSTQIPNELELGFARDLANQCAIAIYKANLVQENTRLLSEAQAALQLREAFMHIAAHELKTPLTVLKGWLQLTERQMVKSLELEKLPQDSKFLQTIGICQSNLEKALIQARQLELLVSDMTDATAIIEDNLLLELHPLDLREVVEQALQDQVPPNNSESKPQIEAKLESKEPLWIRGDRFKLVKALDNLLDNALKFSPSDSKVYLTLQKEPNTRQVLISIHDNGLGIAEEERKEIFRPYYQKERNYNSRHFGGMGLGLFIAKAIVEAHQGELQLSPDAQSGTTFIIRLRLLDAQVTKELHNPND